MSLRPMPSAETGQAAARYQAAERELQRARDDMHAAIVRDLQAGVRQADLARVTGYSRERIRQIERDAEQAGA